MDLQAAREAFVRDGHVSLAAAVDACTVKAAVDHLLTLQTGRGDAAVVTAPLDADPFLAHLAANPRLTEIAAALLESPVTAFGCTYVVKPAGRGLPALWHQDGHPWRTALGITDAVTLWLALDQADAENGCLRVIPGSHTAPAAPLQARPDEASIFGVALDPALVDATRAVDVVLCPGDVSAHHPDLIHGSEANLSDRPRRALVLRYRAG